MTINWPRFAELIRAHQRFLLVSHIRPDCDALGSELGMALVLEALGKRVRIVNGQATPPNLAFIDPAKRIGVIGQTVQPAELADVEVLHDPRYERLGPARADERLHSRVSGQEGRPRSPRQRGRPGRGAVQECARPKRPAGWSSKRPRPSA